MKQGNALVNFVMILLAVALACYMGIYAFNSFNDPYTTSFAYDYTSKEVAQAEGFLVREEKVFAPQDGIVDVIRNEGEKVGVGQRVARVHKDGQARAMQEEMDRLEGEISVLEYALGQGDTEASSAQLDQTILNTLVQLRFAAGMNDYSDLEDQILDVKSQVLKRDYTYGDGLDLEQLESRRQELVSQYKRLQNKSSGGTSTVWSGGSGLFSGRVDGYETVLTPQNVFDLTPSQLDGLKPEQTGAGTVPGKLVTSNKWYFVTALEEEQTQRLRKGGAVTVSFSGEFNQDISMVVEQIGDAQSGRCAVVLSCERYLSDTLLLRVQSAEVVFAQASGLRVPKTSLRMVTQTVKDDKGEPQEQQILGVYAVVGGQAEFKTVEITGEGADFYVVKPAATGNRALRAGDEIVVRATELYDGKLLEY